MTSRSIRLAVACALGIVASLPDWTSAQAQPTPAQRGKIAKPERVDKERIDKGCVRRKSRGWGPSEHLARLKAWEIIVQGTGNWPIAKDSLRNEAYRCRVETGGWACQASIQVCKSP